MEKRMTIHMVPSTHWDREWYLPFRRFQVRLVRLMDKVISLLESGKDPYFVLDGQTIMLEDYLEVKPWMKERVHALVKAGKLCIGPWYVVPDTFIPCGESLWKNLEIGEELQEAYEGKGNVGYTPDSFGITGQMPQILANFGQRYMMYCRGQRFEKEEDKELYGPEIFTAPDGTGLLSEFGFYSLGAGFVVPGVWRNFSRLHVTPKQAVQNMKDLLPFFETVHHPYHNKLVVCGIDHMEPQETFPELVKALNEAFPDIEFLASNQQLYFQALEKEVEEGIQKGRSPLSVTGEQRGNYKAHFVLGNTLSSRMDIKMMNRHAENLLFSYLSGLDLYEKPCDAFEFLDRDALLRVAERELIKCHPHDSICSCSVDETNADVKNRLMGVTQIADELLKDDLQKIGASLKAEGEKGAILVYNCLPFERSMMVEGELTIPYRVEGNCICSDGKILENSEAEVLFYKRIDIESSKYVYFDEIAKDETRTMVLDPACGPEDFMTGIRYRFLAEKVPAMGFKCFYLGKREDSGQGLCTDPGNSIENDRICLTVNEDGSVRILDKKKGVEITKTHILECSTDTGDEYTYSNPKGEVSFAGKGSVISRCVGADVSAITVSSELTKPGGIPGEIRAESTFRLEKGSDLIRIQTKICNNTEEFRIRALFTAPGEPEYAYSDTAFDLTARPVYHEKELTPMNIMTMPLRNLVSVPAEGFDLAIYSASSQEYETVRTDEGSVTALTLLRSVRKVYATDCVTRDESSMGRGTRWFTQDGKMKGCTELNYAFRLTEQGMDAASVLNDALSYQLPLLCRGIAPEGEQEAADLGGFTLDGAVLSRIEKKADGMTARIYNPSEKETKATFRFRSGEVLEVPLGKKKIANVDISAY